MDNYEVPITGRFMSTLSGHDAPLNYVCATNNGKYIMSSCSDNFIVWELQTENNWKCSVKMKQNHLFKYTALHISCVTNDTKLLFISEFDIKPHVTSFKTIDEIKGVIGLEKKKLDDKAQATTEFKPHATILTLYCFPEMDDCSLIPVFGGTASGNINVYCEKNKVLPGHTNSVYCLCGTSNGKYLISGSADKTIRIWDWRNQMKDDTSEVSEVHQEGSLRVDSDKQILQGHDDIIRSICLTSDDTRIISGSNDKTVRVWDRENAFSIMTLQGHTDAVGTVCMNADGDQIISGGEDCMIRLWDLDTGAAIRILSGHLDCVTSICAIPHSSLFISASCDKTVRIWNIKDSPIVALPEFDCYSLIAMVHLKDQQRMLTAFPKYLTLWDTRTMSKMNQIDVADTLRCMCVKHDQSIIVAGISTHLDTYSIKLWQLKKNDNFKFYHTFSERNGNINCIYCANDKMEIFAFGTLKRILFIILIHIRGQ